MNELLVREATVHDIDSVLPLMQGLAAFEGYSEQFKVNRNSLEQLIEHNTQAGVLLAAEDSGEVPYCGAGMLVYFYQPFTYALKPWMVIKELFVVAKCRGRGVGEALFNAAQAHCIARGGSKIKWEVLVENQSAQRFYKRLGGQTESRWQIMSLEL
jgi:ribosomal protein S18 acetylase RimI-like enzyme